MGLKEKELKYDGPSMTEDNDMQAKEVKDIFNEISRLERMKYRNSHFVKYLGCIFSCKLKKVFLI